jgi:hypothetical protein
MRIKNRKIGALRIKDLLQGILRDFANQRYKLLMLRFRFLSLIRITRMTIFASEENYSITGLRGDR